jgi:hypothetical protein
MSWDVLVEIELDEGTLKYSINGVSPSGGPYDGVVESIGDVVREVTPAGGVSPHSIVLCFTQGRRRNH